MTSLLSAKKRAEEFAAVVDGGADESTLRPELAELVGVVGTLQRHAQAGAGLAPRPEFTATLRERLMAEAATSLANDNLLTLPVRKKGSRERRIALAASSLVLVGGTAGMAAAAQNALPGEALYPIKRGLEKAQTTLATSGADRGQDLLAQADSRLVEVQGLFDSSGNLSQVPGTIEDFTRQAHEASDVLLNEFGTSRDASLVEELRTFAADNLRELQELSKSAPPELQDELALAADALMEIDSKARAACPSCAAELPSLEMPMLFLTANEAREAMDAVGRVRVDNSHPIMSGEVVIERSGTQDQSPAAGDGAKEPGADVDGTTGNGGGDTGGGSELELPDGIDTAGPEGGSDTIPEVIEGLTDGDGGGDRDGVTGGSKGDGTKGSTGTKGGTDAGVDAEDVIPDDLEDAVDTLVP